MLTTFRQSSTQPRCVVRFAICTLPVFKCQEMKFRIYAAVPDEISIWKNCCRRSKQYGQVILLSVQSQTSSKNGIRVFVRTADLYTVFSRDSVCHLLRYVSRVSLIPLLKIFDPVLTYCQANSSGTRHGPCVTMSMAPAEGNLRS
jgi:hypothetical protein